MSERAEQSVRVEPVVLPCGYVCHLDGDAREWWGSTPAEALGAMERSVNSGGAR